MNLYQHIKEKMIVDLLPNTATNKYGNKLLWIRLENKNVKSIWEKDFIANFVKCTD